MSETNEQPLRAVSLHEFEGQEVWQEGDENARLRGYFPLSPGAPGGTDAGAENVMVVSFELAPGDYLPSHRDSEEELLVVTEGTVEATVGDDSVELGAGESAVVPEMVPHAVRNVGDETARVVGFFPSDELTATFESPLEPFGTNEVTVGPPTTGEGGE